MLYQVIGNALNLFTAFNVVSAAQGDSKHKQSEDLILKDLAQTYFYGTSKEATQHIRTWDRQGKVELYQPGLMSAEGFYTLFGPDLFPMTAAQWQEQYLSLSFAFVNDASELCGLSLVCSRQDPSKWYLAVVTNTHLAPEKRHITLLTGFDPEPYIKKPTQNLQLDNMDPKSPTLLGLIGSKHLQSLLLEMIDPDSGQLNLRIERIVLLLSRLDIQKVHHPIIGEGLDAAVQKQVLNYDAPILDILAKYHFPTTKQELKHIISGTSPLQPVIQQIQFKGDYARDKKTLESYITLYDAKLLEACKDLLADDELLFKIAHLLQSNYAIKNLGKIELIFKDKDFIKCLPLLIKFPLGAQELTELYDQEQKRAELKYINTLQDENIKKVVLIFWIKSNLDMQQYVDMVALMTQNPALAASILDLHATNELTPEQLLKCVSDGVQRQIEIIQRQFADVFTKHTSPSNQETALRSLGSEMELIALSNSFAALKSVTLKNSYRAFNMALQNDKEGKLARLFLPQFLVINDIPTRTKLIELFFKGIIGSVGLGAQIDLVDEDTAIRPLATQLYNRFLCAFQLQELDLPEDMIRFAAQGDEIADNFRQIIMRVDEECKLVHTRLNAKSWDSSDHSDVKDAWEKVDKDYRKKLYTIAFKQITEQNKSNLMQLEFSIKSAELDVLKAIDRKFTSELKSIVHLGLVIIANIVIAALGLGLFHAAKEKYFTPGSYPFFYRSTSAEKIMAVDKEVLASLEPLCSA